MTKIEHNGHKILLYDSIENLPITDFQKYSLNIMLDANIGSDIEAFDNRCFNIRRLMRSDVDKADKEIMNLQQSLRMIMSETSPQMRSFASLVHSIDGEDFSQKKKNEADLDKILAKINNTKTPYYKIKEALKLIKKK